jgi:phage tail tape-measure protein
MYVGAISGCADTAAMVAQRGATECEKYAGPMGSAVGGALGWAYGSIAGLWMGALLGTILGANHYATKETPAAKAAPSEPATSEEAPAAKETAHHPKTRKPNKPAATT